MEGCNPMLETQEKENLIAAARLIVSILDSDKIIAKEAKKTLVELRTRLSSTSKIDVIEDDDDDDELSDIKKRINSLKEKIMTWEGDGSMIWDCDPEVAKEYLKMVVETQRLAQSLESLNLSEDNNVLLTDVSTILQVTMARIKEEFRHILIHSRQNFDHELQSFRSSQDSDYSAVSFGDVSTEDSVQKDGVSSKAEVFIMDLVDPQVIPDLKSIATLMFDLNYGQECTQTFISARKDALEDFLFILDIEKFSIEDYLKMEWVALNSKIRRWSKAIRIFVQIYLASEKFLCEQIFEHGALASSFCFFESSKASVLQILSFAEAIVVGPHQPDRLHRIIDMYEALEDLRPDIESLYHDDCGSYLRTKFQDLTTQLGDYACITFLELKNAVGTNKSNIAFPNGGVHHLTHYVMNYIEALIDHSDSLNSLLKNHSEADDQDLSSSPLEDDSISKNSSLSPMGLHFQSLTSVLESNLEEKSRLYKEEALGHLFLMNNVNHMAEKAKGSELRRVLGDNWIRQHNLKLQQHAMSYERCTWSSTLYLLSDEGVYFSGLAKTLVKEKLQGFYTAFEEIYKSQTRWSIPNAQLRDDVRISASLKVIPAYRTFVGRFGYNISNKYIKYTSGDLENYLLDLFEGSPKSLHRK